MSSVLFFVEFKLQERRPLAVHTHAKEQVNSTVHFYNINVLSLEIVAHQVF